MGSYFYEILTKIYFKLLVKNSEATNEMPFTCTSLRASLFLTAKFKLNFVFNEIKNEGRLGAPRLCNQSGGTSLSVKIL